MECRGTAESYARDLRGDRRTPVILDRTAQEAPAQLVALLRRFEQLEQTEAPSIAPTLEELAGPMSDSVSRSNV